MKKTTSAALRLTAACAIFGTIGIVRRYTGLSSGLIAAFRGIAGALFLLAVTRLRGRKPDGAAIRKTLPVLLLSGAAIGFNWILLFEAYRYTTVAVATLCYYMAPILVLLLSPVVLHEKLTVRQAVCVPIALAGVVLISGVTDGLPAGNQLTGILFGLGAAVLYASVMLMNHRLTGIQSEDRTLVQLAVGGLVALPYALLAEGLPSAVTGTDIIALLVMACVHTGLAYTMWFGAMTEVPAAVTALLSYIDPIVAVILSAVLFGEVLTPVGWVGAVLLLGAAAVSGV